MDNYNHIQRYSQDIFCLLKPYERKSKFVCSNIWPLNIIKFLCSNSKIASFGATHTLCICTDFFIPPLPLWHLYLPVVGGPCPPVGQKPAVLQTESWLRLLTYLESLPVYITWVIVTWDNYTQLSSLTGVLRCHCLPILTCLSLQVSDDPQLCQNHLLMLNKDT